jgi:hypothetical protein
VSQQKEQRLPLHTLADAQKWVEKSLNEIEPNTTSIARGNARISCVKAFFGGLRLALDYAKLHRQGARVKELAEFVRLEGQTFTPAKPA